MEARLQRRIQRYGWDLAANDYEPLWRAQLARAQTKLLTASAPGPGERVLDVACGTGLIAIDAAFRVAPRGEVVGVDLSERMIAASQRRARSRGACNARFERMDAERLDLPDADFDVALCGLGLMYMPDPVQALREMRRVLRPGGRLAVAVWGDRARCGWSSVFEIVDAEVASEVCPLFFRLGQADLLAQACAQAGLRVVEQERFASVLEYRDAGQACDAAFAGGPVALAWSRFDAAAKSRARERYVESLSAWRHGEGYRVPGEFLVVSARPC